MKARLAGILGGLPTEWPIPLLPAIAESVRRSGKKIIVLDDDPTGTQTVYDVPVLTEWPVEALVKVIEEPGPVAYILTNSRSLPAAGAQELNRAIARNLRAATKLHPRKLAVVSRSDSTLRGHYPAEVDAFIHALDEQFDATLLIPAFIEGGRFTVGDTHYVQDGDWLIPAAETESARDQNFGYTNSDLRLWTAEKYRGRISPESVASISILDEREGGPACVAQKLQALTDGQVCVVNAASYRDLEVFVAGLLIAESRGKRFFYRTAASFVQVRGGLAAHPLLDLPALLNDAPKGAGGLIAAGSFVERSSAQIAACSSLPNLASIEVSAEKVVDAGQRESEIQRVAGAAEAALGCGRDAMVFTSRQLVTGADREHSLHIGNAVSAALVEIVQRIATRPAWVIAKGGITSSDIATKALGVKRALVLGQAVAGVPVWLTGGESRWPQLLYVVFPGNVGSPETLVQMIQTVRSARQAKAESAPQL